ncbi:MAG: hypothetical protein DWQ07_11650 [Chloroflexi bacterium]|nr:MAG: hypothetical protein DWQ07_11650 [Chloroflexota bacterium]MBL1197140.1 hypothetical protein [Chloroflexota bacterium]NOH14435.1 hypothetical protein [Chloroflexota bacterium]
MKLDFRLEVKGDTVSMACPQANWHINVPNSVLYDITENKIMAPGETPATMMQEEPEWWQENQSFVGVCEPFSALGIEAGFAFIFILYYTELARQKLRSPFWRNFLYHRIDKLRLELIIPDFLKLHENIREKFEFQLITTRDFRRFRINDNRPKWRFWQFPMLRFLLVFLYLIMFLSLFNLYRLFLRNEIIANAISHLNDFVSSIFIGLIPAIFLLLISIFVAHKIWSVLIMFLYPKNLAKLLIKHHIGNKKSQKTQSNK